MEIAIAVVGISLFCAALAPAVFLGTSPFSFFDEAGGLRKMMRAARGPAFIHGGIALAAASTSALAGAPPWVIIAIPLAACVALIVVSLRVARPLRSIHRWGLELADERTRAAARQSLLAFADRTRQEGGATASSFAISIATTLINGRLYADAASVIDGCSDEDLSDHERELASLARLSTRVSMGDANNARKALATVPELEHGTIHFYVRRNLEARLLVLENEPRAALALLDEVPPNPIVECGRLVSRAHAFASLGEMAELERTLDEIAREHGDAGLRRVIEPEGPASARTRIRLRGVESAFR